MYQAEYCPMCDKKTLRKTYPCDCEKTSSKSDYAKLSERLQSGRDYLMAVSPEEISVEKCLIAFGWDSNGFE